MTTGEEKRFSFEAVLSVVTPLLFGSLSEILSLMEHMVGAQLFDFQLPRTVTICRPVLVEMFPGIDQLIDVDAVAAQADQILVTKGRVAAGEFCDQVVAEAQAKFGTDEIIIPAGCAANPAQKLHEMHSGGNKNEVTS